MVQNIGVRSLNRCLDGTGSKYPGYNKRIFIAPIFCLDVVGGTFDSDIGIKTLLHGPNVIEVFGLRNNEVAI